MPLRRFIFEPPRFIRRDRYSDGKKEVIKAGQTYVVTPGHIPTIPGPDAAVMVEFSEDTAKVVDTLKKDAPPPKPAKKASCRLM